MNQLISFFMALLFTVMNLFGIEYNPSDLEAVGGSDEIATSQELELYRLIYETETQWLSTLQLSNGAIPMTRAENGELRMSPYFADFAALAMLDKAQSYADNVKAYTDWHFDHLNTAEEDRCGIDATIYDYTITVRDGEIISEKATEIDGVKTYDSSDSYAATFLMVLEKYYAKTGDSEYILSHAKDIERIAGVMVATMNRGLTFATADHMVKYLMDNCEVYEGFLAAAELFEKVICPADSSFEGRADKYRAYAEEIRLTINTKLYNPVSKHYTPEVTIGGIHTKLFSWDTYYPCATAQLFPIICGVIEPDTQRAQTLYDKFCESYNWQNFDYPDDFYWGANVYAAALMNDVTRVTEYMENYSRLLTQHSYPLYNADSARASMAAYLMLQSAGQS